METAGREVGGALGVLGTVPARSPGEVRVPPNNVCVCAGEGDRGVVDQGPSEGGGGGVSPPTQDVAPARAHLPLPHHPPPASRPLSPITPPTHTR
jgi:hypothetical protein